MRFLVLVLVALVGLASPALADKKVALVIGNADYARVGRLANPVRDADAIAKLLTDAGFTSVRKVTDANLAALRQAMQAFEEEADGADVGVIFYSGHGIELGGTNYLIPTDAQLDKDHDVKWQTVPLDGMMETLAGVSKLKLVLLDACRDNPFIDAMKRSGQTRSVSRGLARVDVGADSDNTLIAYATAPGDLAQDGNGDNSPFTTALLKELTKPGKEIRMALGFVRDDVRDATQGRQVPFQTGSMGGEPIYLGRALEPSGSMAPAAPVVTVPAAIGPDADAGARADFAIAKEINTASGWEAFLRKYPSGLYADLARELKAKLSGQPLASIQPATTPAATASSAQSVPLTECDRLAASPTDPNKPVGVAGVEFEKITPEAVAACRDAVAKYPSIARFQYELGRSLKYEFTEAMTWFRKAADQGYADAQYEVGVSYTYERGVPQDYQQAMTWYRKAADQGHAEAQFKVGLFYRQGWGVSEDDQQAMTWYRKAADQGHAEAQFEVGQAYDGGWGVTEDDQQAMIWYRKAADQGYAYAQFEVGFLYERGSGVSEDNQQAAIWYRKAADQEFHLALDSLGEMYDKGRGVAMDPNAAAECILKLIETKTQYALVKLKEKPFFWSIETRKSLQRKLKQRGYYDGAITGAFGRGTIDALEKLYSK